MYLPVAALWTIGHILVSQPSKDEACLYTYVYNTYTQLSRCVYIYIYISIFLFIYIFTYTYICIYTVYVTKLDTRRLPWTPSTSTWNSGIPAAPGMFIPKSTKGPHIALRDICRSLRSDDHGRVTSLIDHRIQRTRDGDGASTWMSTQNGWKWLAFRPVGLLVPWIFYEYTWDDCPDRHFCFFLTLWIHWAVGSRYKSVYNDPRTWECCRYI